MTQSNHKTTAFMCGGDLQFVEVEYTGLGNLIRRRLLNSGDIVDEITCPATSTGCSIDEISISSSGTWLVTSRTSGQGECATPHPAGGRLM